MGKVSKSRLVPLLTNPPAAVVQFVPSCEICTSNRDDLSFPLKKAIFTPLIVFAGSRQNCIHCGSPLADHRVARLLSSTLAATLPSSALAITGTQGGGPETVMFTADEVVVAASLSVAFAVRL